MEFSESVFLAEKKKLNLWHSNYWIFLLLTNEVVPEISSIAVLHDQEDVRGSLYIVIQLDDVHIPQVLGEREGERAPSEGRMKGVCVYTCDVQHLYLTTMHA